MAEVRCEKTPHLLDEFASDKRMDNPMLSVDFWPGGVMVGGVRNGIVTLRDNIK